MSRSLLRDFDEILRTRHRTAYYEVSPIQVWRLAAAVPKPELFCSGVGRSAIVCIPDHELRRVRDLLAERAEDEDLLLRAAFGTPFSSLVCSYIP